MSAEKQKKTKQHDCQWKKWIDEVYRPWYEQRIASTEGEEGDEGGNPGGPPPPPPPLDDDDNGG